MDEAQAVLAPRRMDWANVTFDELLSSLREVGAWGRGPLWELHAGGRSIQLKAFHSHSSLATAA